MKLFCVVEVEYHLSSSIAYQRFESEVQFQGELCQYYNPTYFFVRITNQKESYDEMHRDLKLFISLFRFVFNLLSNISFSLFYNKNELNQSYFPQSGDFCVAKCCNDLNWYRARIIRLIGLSI